MRKLYYVMPLILTFAMMAGCNKATPSPTPEGTTPTTTTQPSLSPTPSVTGTPAATTTPAAGGGVSAADAIYKSNCMSCHGTNMEGAVGPNLKKVGSRLSPDDIAGRIANGKGGMPAFKGQLSDTDIHALANWLSAMK